MVTSPEPGLRERKRAATHRAIQRAALAVVRERGLDGATVDEIARVADVSPRTFFNYFATKEDAILGELPTLEGNTALEWFIADRGPLLRGLARVITVGTEDLLSDAELAMERRAVGKQYPELAVRRMASVHRFEAELGELVARRLRDERPELTDEERADRGRLAALSAFAFVRHAWFTWLEHPDAATTLSELVTHAFDLGEELMASSHPTSVG